MWQPISIPQGEIKYFTIYNGQKSGSLSYGVTFSGAKTLGASAISALALLTINMWERLKIKTF